MSPALFFTCCIFTSLNIFSGVHLFTDGFQVATPLIPFFSLKKLSNYDGDDNENGKKEIGLDEAYMLLV